MKAILSLLFCLCLSSIAVSAEISYAKPGELQYEIKAPVAVVATTYSTDHQGRYVCNGNRCTLVTEAHYETAGAQPVYLAPVRSVGRAVRGFGARLRPRNWRVFGGGNGGC